MVALDMIASKSITVTKSIQAPAADVYRAFTDQDWLRYWMADDARISARVGGYVLLTWNQNAQYVTGTFSTLDKAERVAFSWQSNSDVSASQVEVIFQQSGDTATEVILTHSNLADDVDAVALQRQWETRLNTLGAMLEDGIDLRITDRVIVGIYPEEFTADDAARLGVPVTEGTRVGGVIPNYSAAAAGLQADDVIVKLDGKAVTQAQTMTSIVEGRKPGDTVEIVFYRGAEQHTVPVKLKGYPMHEPVSDFGALADRLAGVYADFDKQVTALFDGVSEEQANHKPGENEWNAREVVAHLIMTERWLQAWVGGLMSPPEEPIWSSNAPARIQAVTSTYPTSAATLDALRRAWAETVAVVRGVPADTPKHHSALWWTAFEFEFFLNRHTPEHLEQIDKALQAARA